MKTHRRILWKSVTQFEFNKWGQITRELVINLKQVCVQNPMVYFLPQYVYLLHNQTSQWYVTYHFKNNRGHQITVDTYVLCVTYWNDIIGLFHAQMLELRIAHSPTKMYILSQFSWKYKKYMFESKFLNGILHLIALSSSHVFRLTQFL